MKQFFLLLTLLMMNSFANAKEVVNVYVWSGEISPQVIQQFEKETGIKVNFSTYDSNETMYTKLKAVKNTRYDVLLPSNYYIERMSQQGLLEKLDHHYLPNLKNLDPLFRKQNFDQNNIYSIPYVWGVTGIFVNTKYIDPKEIRHWRDLWQEKYRNQLLLLDDPREIFSIALITLGYDPNDSDPLHIQAAYQLLKELLPNVKVFNSGAVESIIIDEDASIGVAWNGSIYNASRENPNIQFIYPEDKFVIWSDNLAIPKNAPHLKNAYQFINYLLKADISQQVTLTYGFPTSNLVGQQLLPKELQENLILFPSRKTLSRGVFTTNVNADALFTYSKYWNMLKLSG